MGSTTNVKSMTSALLLLTVSPWLVQGSWSPSGRGPAAPGSKLNFRGQDAFQKKPRANWYVADGDSWKAHFIVLPPGWTAYTKGGKTWYYQASTRKSQWEKPTIPVSPTLSPTQDPTVA